MISKIKNSGRWSLHTSPWIIIGSVGILLIIVVALAFQNYSREKKYMSRILAEKGVALIRAVEAGTRTGMMGMRWGKEQVQTLLEETSQLPDVQFLAVLDKNGLILAHSDRALINSNFNQSPPMIQLSSIGDSIWQVVDMQQYGRSFIVYSYFRLFSGSDKKSNQGRCMSMGQGEDWCFPSKNAEEDKMIIVGLNPKPFDDAQQEDIRNTMIISGVLIILGLAGFISMFWMYTYRSTKRALQDTTAFADEVAISLPVGLIATNKDGKIAFYNSAAERITSIDLSEALGKDPENILPSHICGLREILNRGEIVSEEEMECEFIEGKIVPVSISASKIINEEGQFVGQVLLLRDLGEERRLHDAIRHKEKLAAIGGLAAGVAHEIRNPLSSIKGIASYYKSKFEDGSEDKEMAGVMIEEVDRLSRAVSELLELARPAKLNIKSSNVNNLLEHSVRLIQREATAKNVRIQLNITADSLLVDIDPDRLSQSLLNLYLNALQAMPNGGQLTIDSSAVGGAARIDIRDSGAGICLEDLSKIFDPYFTTKSKGTGLGLAIVQKIIEAHHGIVKVRSAIGQGSVFSIILPLKSKE